MSETVSEAQKCVLGWLAELRSDLERLKQLTTKQMSFVVLGDTVRPAYTPTDSISALSSVARSNGLSCGLSSRGYSWCTARDCRELASRHC
jgi:hypothetical protein